MVKLGSTIVAIVKTATSLLSPVCSVLVPIIHVPTRKYAHPTHPTNVRMRNKKTLPVYKGQKSAGHIWIDFTIETPRNVADAYKYNSINSPGKRCMIGTP